MEVAAIPVITLNKAVAGLARSVAVYKSLPLIETGVLAFDGLFGGRMPSGKILEFAGLEGTGKTTLLCYVARCLAERGLKTAFIDTERAISPSMITGTGMETYLGREIHIIEESTYRGISTIMDQLIFSDVSLIVIDSIVGAKPAKLLMMNVEDVEPGLNARIQSTFFQKYKDLLAMRGITLALINQMRTKIRFTAQTTVEPAAGRALRFFADARFILRTKEILKRVRDGVEEEYGADILVQTLKNKLSGNQAPAPMTIIFGQGVSNAAYLVDLLIEKKKIERNGAFYEVVTPEHSGTFQGRAKIRDHIKNNYQYFSQYIDVPIVKETPAKKKKAKKKK